MTSQNQNGQPSRAWLARMAEAEDRCRSVAVGGLASDLGMLGEVTSHRPRVLGRLVEWSRIKQGLSDEQFAQRVGIELGELLAVEADEDDAFSARIVFKLAQALKLPAEKLMVLAGLAEDRDAAFEQATVRFAAQSSTASLSKDQRRVLEEYVKVIVEAADGR